LASLYEHLASSWQRTALITSKNILMSCACGCLYQHAATAVLDGLVSPEHPREHPDLHADKCHIQQKFAYERVRMTPVTQVSPTALNTSENILMCAPTGAGKTNVAMLSILHTMSLYRNATTGKIDTSKFKIVYVAPMKVCSISFRKFGGQ